jgi:hypothetical protein
MTEVICVDAGYKFIPKNGIRLSKNLPKAKAILKIKANTKAKTKARSKADAKEAEARPNSTFQYWFDEAPEITCMCWTCKDLQLWDSKTKKFTFAARYDLSDLGSGVLMA